MATISKDDVSTTAGIAAAFNSMKESLDKIEKNTAVMGSFAETAENLAEAGRAEKLRDNEQKKQTGFLAGLFKRSKEEKTEKDKDKGFFARHWLKLLLAGLALFALFKAPISLFADVHDFVKKHMTEILIGLGTIAAGMMAVLAWMGKQALDVYRGLKALRDIGRGAKEQKVKQKKPQKTPKSKSKFSKPKTIEELDKKMKAEQTARAAKKIKAEKPTIKQKLLNNRFWNLLPEQNLAEQVIVDEIEKNPHRAEKIIKRAEVIQKKFPGTSPLISDDMKANVARSRAQGIPIDKSKMPHKGPLDRPFWDTSQNRHDVSKAIRHGNAGGADLDAEAVKKSQKAQTTWNQKVKPKLKEAAKAAEELEKSSKLKATGKGIGKTLGKIAKYAGPLIWADHWFENRFGHRTNVLGSIFGSEPLFQANVTKPNLVNPGEKATYQTFAEITDPTFGMQLGGDSADDTAAALKIENNKQGRSLGTLPRSSYMTADKVEKVWKRGKGKIKQKVMGWIDKIKFKTPDIRKSVAATMAMNPETAKLLHISGATMSGMGQNMNVTSAFRTRKQQIDAMEWQRENKPEDYKANYSLRGTITPSATSTEEWLSKTSSRHQHGKGFDISWPPDHSKTNAKGKALISALNTAYRANGVKAFAVPEGNHVHIGSGAKGVPLGMAGPEVEKLYSETLQGLEAGIPNTSGTVLQNLNQFSADPHTQTNKAPVVFQDNSTKSANTTTLMPGSATDKGGFWHGVMSVYHGTANWKLQGQGY